MVYVLYDIPCGMSYNAYTMYTYMGHKLAAGDGNAAATKDNPSLYRSVPSVMVGGSTSFEGWWGWKMKSGNRAAPYGLPLGARGCHSTIGSREKCG